jgi:hypothetical protein
LNEDDEALKTRGRAAKAEAGAATQAS